jgi:5-formyltetrahydrofolate cyclo-ligase
MGCGKITASYHSLNLLNFPASAAVVIIMLSKSDLRTQMKSHRATLPDDELARLNAAITANILSHPAITGAKMVLSYLAFAAEADTRSALRTLLEQGKTVIAPPTAAASDQLNCFHFLSLNDPLLATKERKGERVPETCDLLRLQEVDAFLVPGLAWDRRGYRIGYGGGYFDRLLKHASLSAHIVGVSFDFQLVDAVPNDEWDIPVHSIVTESRTLDCSAR